MTTGLIIGKFMPPHKGHEGLIRFARRLFDQVIISMSFTTNDPIPAQLREQWLRETFPGSQGFVLGLVEDNFDRPELPLPERTALWATFLRQRYPGIAGIVSSESYGPFLAQHLNVPHTSFDPERIQFPISGTQIRANAPRHWNYLLPISKPWFVKRFCLIGAESTGKSTLAQRLAKRYETLFVPEVAREMLTSNDFNSQDILAIGEAQTQRVKDLTPLAHRFLFCDTDLITTTIYSQHYLGLVPPRLEELEHQITYDHYFLLQVDVPWVADGLRDLPHLRVEMHERFKAALEARNLPYTLITGSFTEREAQVVSWIETRLNREVW